MISVRPTTCETFANGLGRGRSRSARAAGAAKRKAAASTRAGSRDENEGRDDFMARNLMRRATKVQGRASAHREAERLQRPRVRRRRRGDEDAAVEQRVRER